MKILDTIKKLLRLSGSNNENEAAEALKKAQALALKSGIDLATVNSEEKEESFGQKRKGCGLQTQPAQMFVSSLLREFFDVQIITRREGPAWFLHFVGTEEGIATAIWVNEYLNATMLNLWRLYKYQKKCSEGERDSYWMGIFQTLCARLAENKKQIEKEIPADVSGRYGLMVAGRAEKLEMAFRQYFPDVVFKTANLNIRAGAAYYAGMDAGQKISLNKQLK